MPDNLNIKGIADETQKKGRQKKNRGRKPFVLEARYIYTRQQLRSPGLGWLFRGLRDWYIHSRYHTESARDEAYAAMVKKAENERDSRLGHHEYRKG